MQLKSTTIINKENEIRKEANFLQKQRNLEWEDRLILLLDLAILDGIRTLKSWIKKKE